jgi:HEAT repeat protein
LSNFNDKKVEEALKAAIGDKDARVQDEAINGLAKYKDADIAPLLEHLYGTQKNYFVRAAAVKALASVEGEKAIPIVENALTQDSYEQVIKSAALTSLAMIDSSKAYDTAVEFTKYGELQSLRLQGMNEMVRLEPKREETVNLLKKYLSDPFIWARMVAINSLGRVGDKSIVPLLQDREKTETDGRLQQAARRAIESINKRESRESE